MQMQVKAPLYTAFGELLGSGDLRIGAEFVHQANGDFHHLIIDRIGAGGFPIAINVGWTSMHVIAAGVAVFDFYADSPAIAAEVLEEVLGLLRRMVSGAIRVRLSEAGSTPYRWVVEESSGSTWSTILEGNTLLFNWLGRRAERVLRNGSLTHPA